MYVMYLLGTNNKSGVQMKKSFFLMFILFAAYLYAQDNSQTNSKVISATVFKNKALVTREAELNLPKGIYTIIFSNLPDELIDESIRVSAGGSEGIKVLDVRVEKKFTTETQQPKTKDLELQIDSLNRLKEISADKVSVAYNKKAFVEALKTQSSTYINEKLLMNINNQKDWEDVLLYVDKNLNEIFNTIREENHKILVLDEKINSIKCEIENSQGVKTKNYKEMIVTVESQNGGKIKLYPSYLVQNASWYPLYDARIVSQEKAFELHYFGMLSQSTGEDWNDISITLSTAEPMSVKNLPQMDRMFVNTNPFPPKTPPVTTYPIPGIEYERNMGFPSGIGAITGYVLDKTIGEPLIGANVILENTQIGAATDINGKFYISNIPAGYYTLKCSYIGYKSLTITRMGIPEKNIANIKLQLSSDLKLNEVVILGEKFIGEKYTNTVKVMDSDQISRLPVKDEKFTNVYAGELSTTFEVPAKSSIPSDNTPHKVTIAIGHSPVEFKYTSIPKISAAVYLNGKVVNIKDYPLLEGEVNVFVDNDFINRTNIKTIVPSDTLELALGTDGSIQIKKVLINKFFEEKGFLKGKKQITYDYEIQIQNKRTTEETVTIYDQIPVAMQEDIDIQLIEPIREIKDLGNERTLEWKVNLKPGEKKSIPLKFTVLYPESRSIYGLE